jgi:histidine ammonia-lyase
MSKSENAVLITGDELSLEDISRVALQAAPVEIAKEAYARMESSRGVIAAVLDAGAVAYGINTGFGKLSDVQIPSAQLASLQLNLVRSHCCGVGEPLPDAEVRAMLFLRANVLAKGFSGVRPLLVDTIAAFLNAGVYPVIPSRGSVGASGDLAPLAHLALGLIGEGEVTYQARSGRAGDSGHLRDRAPSERGPRAAERYAGHVWRRSSGTSLRLARRKTRRSRRSHVP